jgi:hypothetical protein
LCIAIPFRASAVKVGLPESRNELTDAALDCTLEELGMCPRAVVFASVYSPEEQEALLDRNYIRKVAEDRYKVAKVQKEKQ